MLSYRPINAYPPLHTLCELLYSGKFSHGAKFRTFRGWVSYRENKNRASLNVRTTCGHDLDTEKAQVILEKARKFATAKIYR